MTTVVAVRARPISGKQKAKGERSCIQISDNAIKVTGPSGVDSSVPIGLNLCTASQEEVWAKFGEKALDEVIAGFNVNTIMYGGIGTGHKYAAFGNPPFPLSKGSGLLPRACQAIFQKISAKANDDTKYLIEVGMMQLSKDSIRDMLSLDSSDTLKITAGDPEKVPSVEGLTRLAVESYEQLEDTLQAAITRSASEFNGQPPGTTSRRQLIVQMHLTKVQGGQQTPSLWNIMVLSAASTQLSNKALSEFHDLVSALANGQRPTGSTNLFKYLDNSVGANAKTFMLTSISQMAINFTQIVDTLKFGATMRKVKSHAAVKEFPVDPSKVSEWAASVEQTRTRALELYGSKEAQQARRQRDKLPHLENLNNDKLLSGQLLYFLTDGEIRIGRADATIKQNIVLSGLGILASHCIIQSTTGGKLSISACSGAKVIHNGTELAAGKSTALSHNDRLRLGSYSTFRVVIPSQAGAKGLVPDEQITYSFVEREINEQAAAQLNPIYECEDVHGSSIVVDANNWAASTKGMSAEVSERIQSMLPLVNEANSISEELHKGVLFEIKLFAKPQIKKGKKGREMDMNVQLTFEDNSMEEILWDCDTFTDRLYEMRDMCNSFLDNGGDMLYLERNYSGENDPFFIKGNEQMIGRSLIYLDPINHLLPISSKTPIIDYNGFSRGMLDMTLTPSLPKLTRKKMEAKFDELETVEKMVGKQLRISLTIKGVKGIPSNLAKEVNVKYRFFMDESYSVTPKSQEKSINPKFNHSQDWDLVVDNELVQYLASDVLELEVARLIDWLIDA